MSDKTILTKPPRSERLLRKPAPARTSVVSATGTDWSALRAMTDAEAEAVARSDPDNPPRARAQLARMKPRPRSFVIRRALRLTQNAFAERFRIPVGTIRDWEQGRTEPDQAARAYLKVIAVDADFVARALAFVPGKQARQKQKA